MILGCRADLKDSFLHVNGGVLERLLGALKVPIVQLIVGRRRVLMWAVEDEAVRGGEEVHLSAVIVEELGFKHNEEVRLVGRVDFYVANYTVDFFIT